MKTYILNINIDNEEKGLKIMYGQSIEEVKADYNEVGDWDYDVVDYIVIGLEIKNTKGNRIIQYIKNEAY